jgi:pimeloyl-ACP methyl ester carboxylesterase
VFVASEAFDNFPPGTPGRRLARLAATPGGFGLVVAPEDQMMPPEHGRRLADLLPKSQLVEIEDSYTVIPLDQPRQMADAVRAFITSTADQSQ